MLQEPRPVLRGAGLWPAGLAALPSALPDAGGSAGALPSRMTAAVLAFACPFSMVHIGIGKFGQWYTDSDLVEQDTNALLLKDDLPEGDWRVDTYKTHDNLGLWLDKSSLQYFGSTAAPSILSFYPALGVKRDVRSEPELSNYALRGLLSVEYLITTPEKQDRLSENRSRRRLGTMTLQRTAYAVYREQELRAHGLCLRLLPHRSESYEEDSQGHPRKPPDACTGAQR
ncbi:MAG: hypothetical protein ACLVJH_09415 [Faecalibacterium prausnitzii]